MLFLTQFIYNIFWVIKQKWAVIRLPIYSSKNFNRMADLLSTNQPIGQNNKALKDLLFAYNLDGDGHVNISKEVDRNLVITGITKCSIW